jgi:hypothetical protein
MNTFTGPFGTDGTICVLVWLLCHNRTPIMTSPDAGPLQVRRAPNFGRGHPEYRWDWLASIPCSLTS